MTSIYMARLGSKIEITNIKVQKTDNSIIKMFEIVLAHFQINDKLGKAGFF